MTEPTTPTRAPIGHANYSGDRRSILAEGPKGPNYLGEMMYPVAAEYDPVSDRTRVGFSLIAPPTTDIPGGDAR